MIRYDRCFLRNRADDFTGCLVELANRYDLTSNRSLPPTCQGDLCPQITGGRAPAQVSRQIRPQRYPRIEIVKQGEMIYQETCYILKCYITELGSAEVRDLTQAADSLASCILARIEFAAAVHRHRRERRLSEADAKLVLESFETDQEAGLWRWHGLSQSLLDNVKLAYRKLDSSVFVRAKGAIHLVCAGQQGFRKIYSCKQRRRP